MDAADVVAGIAAALSVGALTADVVAVEARKAADARAAGTVPDSRDGEPPAGRGHQPDAAPAAALPADTRPLPSVTAYDQLLHAAPAAQPGRPVMTPRAAA